MVVALLLGWLIRYQRCMTGGCGVFCVSSSFFFGGLRGGVGGVGGVGGRY